MRLARRLYLLAAVAVSAMGLTATAVSAQVTVSPEVPPGTSCGTVFLIGGHNVVDGCHVEFQSTGNSVVLHVYIPSKTTISACTWHLEGFVGSDGEGYFTEVDLTAPSGGSTPCTRTACDEPDSTQIPWPFHIEEHAPLNEELEAVICLRAITSGPGGAGSQCELHFELTDLGDHFYELGHADADNGTEVFCENNPPNATGHPATPFPISFEGHFVTAGSERIEIIH